MLIDIDSSNACRHVEGNEADKIRRKLPVRKVEFRLTPNLYADRSPIEKSCNAARLSNSNRLVKRNSLDFSAYTGAAVAS